MKRGSMAKPTQNLGNSAQFLTMSRSQYQRSVVVSASEIGLLSITTMSSELLTHQQAGFASSHDFHECIAKPAKLCYYWLDSISHGNDCSNWVVDSQVLGPGSLVNLVPRSMTQKPSTSQKQDFQTLLTMGMTSMARSRQFWEREHKSGVFDK